MRPEGLRQQVQQTRYSRRDDRQLKLEGHPWAWVSGLASCIGYSRPDFPWCLFRSGLAPARCPCGRSVHQDQCFIYYFFLLNRPPMSREGPQALTLMSTPPADLLVASRHRNTLLAYGGSRLGIGTRRTWLVPFASLFVTAASSMQPKAFMYHFLKDAARTSEVGQEPVGVSGVYLLMARALDDLRCFDARV